MNGAERYSIDDTDARCATIASMNMIPKHAKAVSNDIFETTWDVAVIGGGPAGMMAAGRAAEKGAKVILIEKNPAPGKKLLITGGGRCNVTNAETDVRALLAHYRGTTKGPAANQYLFSAFAQWDVAKTLAFFNERGMPTKVEPGKRVFPVSDTARSVYDVLLAYMAAGKVAIAAGMTVTGFERTPDGHISAVKVKNGKIRATSFILATGGTSHPETGSTGEGFTWLKNLGHAIAEPIASLVPVALSDEWALKLQGITLNDVKLTLAGSGEKDTKLVKKGRVLFTHFGISGPTVINMSSAIREALGYAKEAGEITTKHILELDLLPAQDYGVLNMRLQTLFKDHHNKKLKNALDELIAVGIVGHICTLAGVDENTWCNSVTREQRIRLVHALKHIPLHVRGLLGDDKAIVTSGGVSLDEVDFKTMRSRLIPNLFLIGDVLDIDRPSGGYSLQLCWTTGFVAGDWAGTV